MGVNVWADSKCLLWFDSVQKVRKRIDLIKQTVEKEIAPGNWEKLKYITVDKRITSALPPRVVGHYFSWGKNKIRFTVAGTGIVYDFNDSTNLIERVDRTFYAGYNFGASKFIRKGILYSFGGSGFSVNETGDVNGDGVDDIIIGAPNVTNGLGQSYIIFGEH